MEEIIVSDPSIGTAQYGLTDAGKLQVHTSLSSAGFLDSTTIIVSSDFKRTAETAEMIRAKLGASPIQLDVRLRERYFGDWEGTASENYSKVWKCDAGDPDYKSGGAEGANAVRQRMVEVIQSLEKRYTHRKIILVSHGDPLMLLQTFFEGIDASKHRSLPYFDPAEWRLLEERI